MLSKMASLWRLFVKKSVMNLPYTVLIMKGKFVGGFGVTKKLTETSLNVFQFLEHQSKDRKIVGYCD